MSKAAPEPKANMGEPVPRYDARLKVTGAARYPSDAPVSSPAFAVLVTSPIARGRITGMDLAAAQAVPGVLDILTHENTGELESLPYKGGGGGASTSMQGLGPEIGHDGQIVAMVVADSFEAAREAAYKVQVDYAAETPSATFGSPGVKEQDAGAASERAKSLPKAGDVGAALSAADVVHEAEYGTPTQHHNPIELFTTTCAWNGDELTIHEPSQFVHGLKNNVARKLGIAPDRCASSARSSAALSARRRR
jgi:xanthine dehydrogenase YagR molybdenum-binding subunit